MGVQEQAMQMYQERERQLAANARELQQARNVRRRNIIFQTAKFLLETVISWFWLLLILIYSFVQSFSAERRYDYNRNLKCGWQHYLFWSIVEIGIVVCQFIFPNWFKWFTWMQAFQVVSLALNVSSNISPPEFQARKNYRKALGLKALTFIVSYMSIVLEIFRGDQYKMMHALLFPWTFPLIIIPHSVAGCQDYHEADREITRFDYALHFFVWFIVEIAIIIAKVFVPNWSIFFDFMQELQVHGLVWSIDLKAPYAKFFTGVAGLISYHSVMAILLSGIPLFLAIFLPWFAAFSTCVGCYVWREKKTSSNRV